MKLSDPQQHSVRLSLEAESLLKAFKGLDKKDDDTIHVSKKTWVRVVTIINKLALDNEKKNLGDERSKPRAEEPPSDGEETPESLESRRKSGRFSTAFRKR